MIKVMYYIGTCDKDTCKKELLDRDFYKVFDELFGNYTLQKAQGVYTMRDSGTVVKEDTFVVTTFFDDYTEITENKLKQLISQNSNILEDKLNQESILVEVSEPSVMFL